MKAYVSAGAWISPCGLYRNHLWRTWDAKLPILMFVMLNPSIADGEIDDPTIRKCVGFAERNGFGGILVVNLFAWRATDPSQLKLPPDPIGPGNDASILEAVKSTLSSGGKVVCAWGANGRKCVARADHVRLLLAEAGVTAYVLKLTDDGLPWHPLMLPYTSQLTEWPYL